MMQIIKAARGNITGHFGDKNVPGANVDSHGGMDIGHGKKTTADLRVVAPAAGRVVFAGKSGTYGLCIIIDHGDGYASLLAHLAAVLVYVGFEVAQGQSIAVMGSSGGDWPVHLHQELRLHDVQLDPEKYLSSAPAGQASALHIGEDMGLVVKIKDGDPRGGGDVFYIDRKTIVHLGSDEDVDRAVRLSGRPQAVQSAAELDTFADVLGIPAGEIRQKAKYHG